MPAKAALKKSPAKPKSAAAQPVSSLSAEEVLAFLSHNPSFLSQHADAIGQVTQPEKTANLLSFHAFQATKAEKQVSRLSTRQQQMVATAHANAVIAGSIFQAVLHVMQLNTLGQLRTWLQTSLPEILSLNASRLMLAGEASSATTLPEADILALCPEPITLRTLTTAPERHFYGPKGKLITSDALLRLETQEGVLLGLLALGSTDATRFHAGQSTDLAQFFAHALSIRLAQLLPARS